MFILESKVVPDEPSKDLQWRENGEDELRVNVACLVEWHRQCPSEAENKVLDNGEVVEPLWSVYKQEMEIIQFFFSTTEAGEVE